MLKLFYGLPFLFLLLLNPAYGQDKKEKALTKGREAIRLMDEGKFDESIILLEEAKKLDPENLDYPYEIAYAQYAKKEYKKAAKILEKLTTHKDVSDQVFQLLGNSYDLAGEQQKAIDTYEKGLKKFPESGKLYLESGIIQLSKNEYNKALDLFEKGIEVAPHFPSNYYWATRLYCSSTEEVWGMIYGEIFMNIERNSKRTEEISKLLFDTYRKEIKFTSDSSATVSFSKNNVIDVSKLDDPGQLKLPFPLMVYEPVLLMSVAFEKSIDINSLDRVRTKFIDAYSEKFTKEYPNVLFDYQKKVKDAGHFEAYNHWILMKGDEDNFNKWYEANKEKWNSFILWFTDNKIVINEWNKFHRTQY